MNWHRSVIFLLVILFVMMTGSSLIAQTPGPGRGGRHPGRIRPVRPEGPCLLDQLTEEQQQELRTLIEGMRANDATREEIHEAVIELLTSWGIEIPEGWESRFGDRPGRFEDPIWAQLSEEQRQQVMAKLKELRENEANREEVQTALVELFGSWGIELPENWAPRFHHRRHQGLGSGIMSRLTEEQRQIIRSTVRDMRADGATREEIHAAIIALLEEFGIEIPDGYGDYRGFEEPQNPQKEQIVLKIKNRPNPFNPDTHISYSLTNSANVKLTVYNIQGQLVRSLVNEYQPAGDYAIYWDGCNQNGERAVSGMYIYQITAGNESISQQMIMMK
jgi:Spy/CpxP family protein refolding chaperone